MKPSELLRKQFGFSPSELKHYVASCPRRYKTYYIDKRGGRGKREISQPSKDLKAIQRFLISELLNKTLFVHDSAKAYKINTSILDNARPHLANRFLLKMDFTDFFPSILASDFQDYLVRKAVLNDEDEIRMLCNIFFKKHNDRLCLSIGSPGSPLISNAIMYDFDNSLSKLCGKEGITYTRYSDDITFSTNTKDQLFAWPNVVRTLLSEINYPKLTINKDKTVFSSKRFNRHVTGVTISNDGKASIGRDRKRALRTQIYNAKSLNRKDLAKLRGHIAFAFHIEPDLKSKLSKKYPAQLEHIFLGSE